MFPLQLLPRVSRSRVVGRLGRGWFDALPVVQFLLPLLLIGLHLAERLLLPRIRGRVVQPALVLLHAQLQRILLLLTLQLVLLQRPCSRIVGAQYRRRHSAQGHRKPPRSRRPLQQDAIRRL